MVITISESKILSLQMKGFIFCGDMVISPENPMIEDINYLKSHGYKFME